MIGQVWLPAVGLVVAVADPAAVPVADDVVVVVPAPCEVCVVPADECAPRAGQPATGARRCPAGQLRITGLGELGKRATQHVFGLATDQCQGAARDGGEFADFAGQVLAQGGVVQAVRPGQAPEVRLKGFVGNGGDGAW